METDSPVVYHGTSESRFPTKEGQQIKVFLHHQLSENIIGARLTTGIKGQGIEPPPFIVRVNDVWEIVIHPKYKIVRILAQIPQLHLTAQEKEVFRECNRESLYYRCLPFAFTGIAVTHMAVKKGILSAHPIWGSGLKMAGAAFVGWFIGKLSYGKACEDKFLQLENSAIGNAVRRRRGYIVDRDENEFYESKTDDMGLKKDSYTSYSDYHSSTGSLNLDVDKNVQYSGLDDRERPSTDRENLPTSEETEPVRTFTTYDDLRRINREEFAKSQQRPYTQKSSDQSPVQRPWANVDSTPPRRFNMEPNDGTTKNKYGDSWDNSKFL